MTFKARQPSSVGALEGTSAALPKEYYDAISAANQKTSALLRLPGEILNAIYRLAFEELKIFFFFFLITTTYRTGTLCQALYPPESAITGLSATLLALTMTCRKTYADTSLLPFRLFEFGGNFESMRQHFLRRLLPAQFNAIKCLDLGINAGHLRVMSGRRGMRLLRMARRLAGAKQLKRVVVVWTGTEVAEERDEYLLRARKVLEGELKSTVEIEVR